MNLQSRSNTFFMNFFMFFCLSFIFILIFIEHGSKCFFFNFKLLKLESLKAIRFICFDWRDQKYLNCLKLVTQIYFLQFHFLQAWNFWRYNMILSGSQAFYSEKYFSKSHISIWKLHLNFSQKMIIFWNLRENIKLLSRHQKYIQQ